MTIPDTLNGMKVTAIGQTAFYLNWSLSSVNIPEGVTTIGDMAFFWCSRLSSVTIPDSLEKMGINPFGYCERLSVIKVNSTHPVFVTIEGVLFNMDSKTLIWYPMTKNNSSYSIP